ncbi:hypothetical protein VNO78_11626 [Psophocarpus tetragonolobus]|uniref:Uncharacterized protein n=1 Tax=Psophocarpus tetragonolobus TaxID=3891 RepID=A0AAN9XNW4_PSOTE
MYPSHSIVSHGGRPLTSVPHRKMLANKVALRSRSKYAAINTSIFNSFKILHKTYSSINYELIFNFSSKLTICDTA